MNRSIENLIEALKIMQRHEIEGEFGTHCEHDELTVWGLEVGSITDEEIERLDELGFFVPEDDEECLMSYRYGSC